MDSFTQNRIYSLRQRLIDLNYPGSFGSESADLIERLIGDVVSTTASYKQLQERESRLSSDFNLAQAQLFPLRKENTRVNRENQQLHADSIKQRDLISAAAENHNLELKSLENKINELNYLAVVRERDLRDMEREKERIKEAYESATTSGSKKDSKGSIRFSSPLPVVVPSIPISQNVPNTLQNADGENDSNGYIQRSKK